MLDGRCCYFPSFFIHVLGYDRVNLAVMILYKSGKVSVWKAISFIAIAPIAFVLLDAVFNVG